ncbi:MULTISPECIES: ABC transporter ATP-binding protein [Clostridia]|uniref:ABC transporter ATP-binding protein n=1 Tax=Clostridia TaxID=186801 RepID=UPI001C102E07|nr:ABC transporter ATP-binding protein [Roseburia sp. MSJ-14]MBQ1474309.1 ABC transporter ATP-binding protein [Ruminococcus sp.]MBU5471936.1 ABC transporter ATP-binding protein [Roseburia sp. MSJ-14]
MGEILRCDNLCKDFGATRALDRLCLSVGSGKIIGLLGPNGAGKTTLIKIVNGLLQPTFGEVLIDGKRPGVETKPLVSYLPDVNYLNNWMTVEQIVFMFADFYADFRSDLAFDMVKRLGINRMQRLKSLSKGNKEKVCLILVMSRNAKLYILDEPIAGVDPATRDYIISTIINNYNPEASVLISTHLISDIESILDEVIFIQNGRVVLQDTVDHIREQNHMSVDDLFREVFKW